MRAIQFGVLAIALLVPCSVFAQDHGAKGEIENIVGVMSDQVMRGRLTALGYTNVTIQKKAELQYHVDAMKNGKPVFLEVHPQVGNVEQFATSELRASHIHTMPLVAPKVAAQH